MKGHRLSGKVFDRPVSIPLPGFINVKVVNQFGSDFRGAVVSIPLPGFINVKVSLFRKTAFVGIVSIPLPGFINVKGRSISYLP